MKPIVAALVLVIAGLPKMSVGAAIPDAAILREHVRDASGERPKSERTVVAFDANGLHGKRTILRSGQDERETISYGPFSTASGTFRGQRWRRTANGQTLLEQPDPGLATEDERATTVFAIATPVKGFVLASLDARGHGTKEYIEAETWRVVRRDVISATETTTYAYDDFRTLAG